MAVSTTTYPLGPGLKGMLGELGINAEDVLRRADLPDDLLNQMEPKVSAAGYAKFFAAVEASVDDPDFPLKLVEVVRPEWFTPPLFAALCSPDLVVAASRLALFKPLIAPMEIDIHRDDDSIKIAYRWLEMSMPPPALTSGFEALFLTRLARLGTREEVRPVAVTVPTMPSAPAKYEQYLGVALELGPEISVTFSDEDAQRPFLSANPSMWAIFEPELRRRLADLEESATTADRARAVLLEGLPSGQLSVDAVARRLAVSSRTLQRRLREEGTNFKELVRGTRNQLARHYLGQTRLTSTEIAYLLGFEEPTSFFRAFHEWTGQTPETMRQSLQQAHAVGPS